MVPVKFAAGLSARCGDIGQAHVAERNAGPARRQGCVLTFKDTAQIGGAREAANARKAAQDAGSGPPGAGHTPRGSRGADNANDPQAAV